MPLMRRWYKWYVYRIHILKTKSLWYQFRGFYYLGWIEINVWLSFLIWRYYHDVKIYRDLVLVNVCVEIFNKPLPSTNFACTNCNTGKFAFRLLCSFCWLKNTFLRKTILHEMWKEEDNDSFMKFWLIICVIMVFMVSIMT